MFIFLEFLKIIDKDFDNYKNLLKAVDLQLPENVNKYKTIYVEGDKNSKDKLLEDYKKFDEELEKKICNKLHSENFFDACFNFLDIANIKYNSSDNMETIISKILVNKDEIKEALRKRGKIIEK